MFARYIRHASGVQYCVLPLLRIYFTPYNISALRTSSICYVSACSLYAVCFREYMTVWFRLSGCCRAIIRHQYTVGFLSANAIFLGYLSTIQLLLSHVFLYAHTIRHPYPVCANSSFADSLLSAFVILLDLIFLRAPERKSALWHCTLSGSFMLASWYAVCSLDPNYCAFSLPRPLLDIFLSTLAYTIYSCNLNALI